MPAHTPAGDRIRNGEIHFAQEQPDLRVGSGWTSVRSPRRLVSPRQRPGREACIRSICASRARGHRSTNSTWRMKARASTIPGLLARKARPVFFHRPYGAFDLRDQEVARTPRPWPMLRRDSTRSSSSRREPVQIMREYALITGFLHLPPLWSLGYMQSRRPESPKAASRCSTKPVSSGAGNCPATLSSISARASRQGDGIRDTGSFASTRISCRSCGDDPGIARVPYPRRLACVSIRR